MKTIEIPSQLTKPYDRALSFLVQLESEARGDGAGVNHKGQTVATAQFRNAIVTAGISKPNSRTGHRQTRWYLGFTDKPIQYGNLLAYLRDREDECQKFEAVEARRVPLKAEVGYIDGQRGDTPSVTLKGERLLHRVGSHSYYHVGAVPRGQSARKVTGGPLVEGPWAYAFEQAAVLSDSAAFRERDAAERAKAIPVESGSLLLIDGEWYRVEFQSYGHIELVPTGESLAMNQAA